MIFWSMLELDTLAEESVVISRLLNTQSLIISIFKTLCTNDAMMQLWNNHQKMYKKSLQYIHLKTNWGCDSVFNGIDLNISDDAATIFARKKGMSFQKRKEKELHDIIGPAKKKQFKRFVVAPREAEEWTYECPDMDIKEN
mmetsp:Transcript_924/g.1490  ORF Transcript_924/g.1490 Transcript_924/m.1490 type:complete len:141 (-) Transcript_924:1097-1519(-)